PITPPPRSESVRAIAPRMRESGWLSRLRGAIPLDLPPRTVRRIDRPDRSTGLHRTARDGDEPDRDWVDIHRRDTVPNGHRNGVGAPGIGCCVGRKLMLA